jgi:hypothetical protein
MSSRSKASFVKKGTHRKLETLKTRLGKYIQSINCDVGRCDGKSGTEGRQVGRCRSAAGAPVGRTLFSKQDAVVFEDDVDAGWKKVWINEQERFTGRRVNF